jgi:hypothetical protein
MTNERMLETAGLTPRRNRKTRVLLGVLTGGEDSPTLPHDPGSKSLFQDDDDAADADPGCKTAFVIAPVSAPMRLSTSVASLDVDAERRRALDALTLRDEHGERESPAGDRIGSGATVHPARALSHSLEERALWGKLGGSAGSSNAGASSRPDFVVSYDASVVYRLLQFVTRQPPPRLITLQVRASMPTSPVAVADASRSAVQILSSIIGELTMLGCEYGDSLAVSEEELLRKVEAHAWCTCRATLLTMLSLLCAPGYSRCSGVCSGCARSARSLGRHRCHPRRHGAGGNGGDQCRTKY